MSKSADLDAIGERISELRNRQGWKPSQFHRALPRLGLPSKIFFGCLALIIAFQIASGVYGMWTRSQERRSAEQWKEVFESHLRALPTPEFDLDAGRSWLRERGFRVLSRDGGDGTWKLRSRPSVPEPSRAIVGELALTHDGFLSKGAWLRMSLVQERDGAESWRVFTEIAPNAFDPEDDRWSYWFPGFEKRSMFD